MSLRATLELEWEQPLTASPESNPSMREALNVQNLFEKLVPGISVQEPSTLKVRLLCYLVSQTVCELCLLYLCIFAFQKLL